ncbi:hypothetical protein [Rhodococcoides yunnanense]|uniref:hypothetical protein n=1 Tax=Rhodococcoides yunnanense TaxID=278209 RepID=UPI000933B694|nr:hypothetical protein [Rhodococcus yunnanensis]
MATEECSSHTGASPRSSASQCFDVEQVTTGSHANGFGRTDDRRAFAFRVHKSTLYVEIYRADLLDPVPDKSDVTAVAEQSVTEIDLTDERSVVAVVRDAVLNAVELDSSQRDSSPVRSFLGRVGSLIEHI